MSEEKFYKYVILRDRDGNYLLPYSGTKGLSDVAFTGDYKDLINAPEEDSFLPASRDAETGRFNVAYPVVINEPLTLDFPMDCFKDGDLAKDTYAVNQDYVYSVATYLVDSLNKEVDDAYAEMSKDPVPEEKWPTTFCGTVSTLTELKKKTGELFDVYYVLDESCWYMCVLNNTGVKIWVNEYEGKKVYP